MTDYTSIQRAISNAIVAAKEDLAALRAVGASKFIISAVELDISNLQLASEIVSAYEQLER
jgi:hypothetical protein